MESEYSHLYEAQLWLERAKDTIHASDINLKHELLLTAINRAYYSMFYCFTALLRSEGVVAKSHSGVINKFSELFIKTNRISIIHSVNFRNAFEYRQSVDYDIEVSISEEEAKLLLQNAHDFYKVSSDYLQNLIRNSNL